MISRTAIFLLAMTTALSSCKNVETTSVTVDQIDSTGTDPSYGNAQELKIPAPSSATDSSFVDELEETWEENIDTNTRFVYEDFNVQRALDRLHLGMLGQEETRTVDQLLNANLRDGDLIKPIVIETGDGTFDAYVLVTQGNIELAYFYYENQFINTIQIIHPSGVPDAMIGPERTYGDLKDTYENPVAYGSEIEGRVYVHIDDIGFRMNAGHGFYEPVDLNDDTEIMLIEF